ncbi:MAG: hypothetical protein RIG62_08175 [Cyclobacteriaceae bacterium]
MTTHKVLAFGFLLLLNEHFLSIPTYAECLTPPSFNSKNIPFSDGKASMLSENRFYYQILPTPINHFTTGEILALPFLIADQIVSAQVISGELPPGTLLHANGLVTVVDETLLEANTYVCMIETIDNADNSTKTKLTITIKAAADQPNRDAIYKMTSTQEVTLLADGDVLASALDPDGEIVAALQVMGTLPPGSELTPQGKLVVKDHAQLVPDIYTAGIATVDKQGNTTFFIITVPIKAGKRAK